MAILRAPLSKTRCFAGVDDAHFAHSGRLRRIEASRPLTVMDLTKSETIFAFVQVCLTPRQSGCKAAGLNFARRLASASCSDFPMQSEWRSEPTLRMLWPPPYKEFSNVRLGITEQETLILKQKRPAVHCLEPTRVAYRGCSQSDDPSRAGSKQEETSFGEWVIPVEGAFLQETCNCVLIGGRIGLQFVIGSCHTGTNETMLGSR